MALKNAPEDQKIMSRDIKKHIVSCVSMGIGIPIIKEIGYASFSISIDESQDISIKD